MSGHVGETPVVGGPGRFFWIAFAIGTIVMLQFGLRGAWGDLGDAPLRMSFAKWIVGADLANDLVVLPVACLVGVTTTFIPRLVRQPVQFALFASAVVLFVVQNALRGTARGRHNPTVQPLNYSSATITVILVVWGIAALWALTRAVQARRTRSV